MYEERNYITVDDYESEKIEHPYDIVNEIGNNKDDQSILRSCMNHFKRKDHPFAVLYDNDTKLSKIVVNQVAFEN